MSYTKPAAMMRTRPRAIGDIWDDIEVYLTQGPALPAAAADPADNVNQTTGGGFSTSAADFQVIGGVCKPSNFPALNAARGYQGQLNRVAQAKGFSRISTDGAIGPATLALHRLVQSVAGGSVMGDPSTCMGIAPDVDVLAAQVQAYADSLGVPATVSAALSIAPPTIVTKSQKTVVAPDAGIAGSLATLSSGEKLVLLGLAGGVGYLLLNKKKKRRT